MIQYDNAITRFGKLILYRLKDEGIKCWIAGGSIRDYFMNTPVKTDIDIFFPNQTEYDKCRKYFIDNAGEIEFENENGAKIKYEGRVFDIIKRFFENPKQTIDAFDFTVSMFAIDTENVFSGETSFIDLAKRQLMFNKITFPASTLSRSFRYYKKGFVMCKGEMKKLFESIQQTPIPDQDQNNDQQNEQEISMSNNRFFTGID